ncbi:unnamed protein product [Urochloa humidicola]
MEAETASASARCSCTASWSGQIYGGADRSRDGSEIGLGGMLGLARRYASRWPVAAERPAAAGERRERPAVCRRAARAACC